MLGLHGVPVLIQKTIRMTALMATPSFKLATTPPSLVHTTIHTQTHAMVSERTPIQFECLLTSEELEVVCNNRRIGDSCDVTSILLSTTSDQNCSARLERRSLSLPLWKRWWQGGDTWGRTSRLPVISGEVLGPIKVWFKGFYAKFAMFWFGETWLSTLNRTLTC